MVTYIPPPLLDPKDPEQMEGQDPGPVIGAYMVAVLRDRAGAASIRQIEWMTYAQIEQVRKASRAGKSGPWVDHWDEMARKTVVRRGAKYLPLTPEAVRAFSMDEIAEQTAPVARKDSGRARLLGALNRGAESPQEPAEGDSGVDAQYREEEGAETASAVAQDVCGADAPSELDMTEPCGLAPDHKGAHVSSEGSWPR